ncbi:uncharacterized protein LY89DRAFT_30609 [Mollisia scopiformis]|uniref:Zn(2)-C6 fungal-type domain-containing protein n=1 Tax=Mollisia scopiformis TaxID=149040 RepID=A0A194XCL3_MOLSC|nr:uncharacterized protein LY89DRAFT_30609 [Mollisia scopiformis]KUJ17910.1 hypothetical protein LY89DRAFT_30609 [Mollisia scopiformis]
MPRPVPENSCTTCRQRKIRCDGTLPKCQNCLRSKRQCTKSREVTSKFIIHTTNPELQSSLFERQEKHPTPEAPRDEPDLRRAQSTVSHPPSIALEDPTLATLFRHYIDVLAPWYDLNDAQRLFSILVPLRALNNSVVFKALIAFSACHMNRTTGNLQHFGCVYHASCVEELLDALNDSSPESQEDFLAATCLLRSYEILNGDMRRHQDHLLGAYSFATNRPIDLTIQGLAQAGTWNYLREEITVALESRRPVRFSAGFHFIPEPAMSDDKCANAITFILAKTINLCFADASTEDSTNRREPWDEIVGEVSSWRQNLPVSFRPFSAAPKPGNVFPSIWFLQPWHVASEQYYSVTEILLSSCHSSSTSSIPFQADQNRERVVFHALQICGLAYTNDDVSARVNAFGPLAFCGRYLTETIHRHGLLRMLNEFSKPTGWPVAPIIEDLQEHWAEIDKSLTTVTNT